MAGKRKIVSEAYERALRGGLPMDKAARMRRAADQGFDVPAYHGTHATDIDGFEISDIGVHVGSTDAANVRLSDKEAVRQGVSNYRTRGRDFGEGSNVLPLKVKASNPLRMEDIGEWRDPSEVLSGLSQSHLPASARREADELAREAWDIRDQFDDMEDWYSSMEADEFMQEARRIVEDNGFDSIVYNNFIESTGKSSDSMIVLDPANIRSTNAAFDPANIGKNDILGNADPRLLAALGGGAGAAALLGSSEAEAAPTDPTIDMAGLEAYSAGRPMPSQTPLSDYSTMDWLKGGADMVADVASAAIRPTLTGPATVMDYLMGVDAQEMERRRSGRDEYLDYQPRTELGNRLSGAGEQGMINLMAPVLAPMMPEPYTQRMLDAYMGRIGPREILALKGLIDTTDLVF